MILSRKFVSDYIDLDENLTIKQIGEDLTRVGNEYDSAEPLINCTNLVVGEVLECEMHPDSDHLHVCKVDIGSEVLNIVCGAPNCRKGLKVIVAKAGAVLPGGEIKKGMIRGQESNGMLCSKAELGLDNKFLEDKDRDGIHEFPLDVEVGSDPIKALGLDDEVIDIELTANRGDELSVLGLAYELGAIYDKKVKDIDLSYSETNESVKDEFNIDIQTEDCSLFLARKVKNVKIKESPDFIKNRLIACGIRPINNVVDISNYVMLETGQPLHYYDADSLGDTLIVRKANDNEKLTTLDNIERTLTSDDIVIANKKGAVGLAGVMGGLTTEVEPTTKNIIIEAAIFDSVSIRKTSKKVLRSEASNRFEKGLDPNRTYMAMERSLNLLEKYADGEVLKDTVIYDKANKDDKVINITVKNINDVLGTDISKEDIINVFLKLGFSANDKKDHIEVIVPTRRLDISIKEDLIEEVGRIYGINNIEGRLPKFSARRGNYDKTTRDIRNKLVDLGLNEVLTQIFIKEEEEGHLYTNDEYETVKLLDPLSVDKAYIRYSLIPTLMKVYNYNKSHNLKDVTIFEMAKGFYKKDDTYGEDYKLAMVLTGEYYLELGNKKKIDFYIVKGIVEELLDYLGYTNRYSFNKDNLPKELHPGVSANINVNGKNIGIIGKVHPSVCKDDVYVVEINLDMLKAIKTGKIKYKEFSKFPSIIKDVAFVVDKNITNKQVIDTINKSSGRILSNVELFDLYEGENIDKDKKSLAYKLTFTDPSKTLTEEEVMAEFNKIIEKVNNTYKSSIRDK